MANFSKYFNEAVKSRTCGDFFHPGRTCTQAKLDLIPGLLAGTVKYFLPTLLIPSLAKFEWSKEFFLKQLILSAKAVFGGFVPAIVAISSFCGFYEHLKKHYFQFYGVPISFGALMAALILPKATVNFLACGGVNHLFDLILEAKKETIVYELKSNLMVGTLLFMTLSSTIVYLFKTSAYRPFWLLHVPHENDDNAQGGSKLYTPGWINGLVRRKEKFCRHKEESCEANLWQELKKVSKIGLLLSGVKSLISSYSAMRGAKISAVPGIILQNFDIRSFLFLPTYCGSFKLLNCLLNRLFYEDTTKNAIMAGFLSGSFFMFYPNFTLNSFALIRSVQLLWRKHVQDYRGEKNTVMSSLKSLPMGLIVLWTTTSILFISRFFYPYLSSRYIVMSLNYITGSLADSVIANYYGILMGLQ